jgi:hypothetical protein
MMASGRCRATGRTYYLVRNLPYKRKTILCILATRTISLPSKTIPFCYARSLRQKCRAYYGLRSNSLFGMMSRDSLRTKPYAEALVGLAREHRMPLWLANGTFYQGWVRWDAGDHEVGEAEMREGMALMHEHRQEIFMPCLRR